MPKQKLCKFLDCPLPPITFPDDKIKGWCLDHGIEQSIIKSKLADKRLAQQRRAEMLIEIMSIDEYRKNVVQPIVNEIARLIDFEQPCISTGNIRGKMSAGHFYDSNSYKGITLNLHNLHIQSYSSNDKKSGDLLRYRQGLIKVYGLPYLEKIEALQGLKQPNLTKSDLISIKDIASAIRTELRRAAKQLSPDERIKLRNEINTKIGVYEPF